MKEVKPVQKIHQPLQAVSVLVVDDHQGMLQSLGDILQEEGYQVSLASSGVAAIEACQKQTFNIILMDVRMPGIDGLETLRRIKDYVKGTLVLLMSAYSLEAVKQQAIQEGAVAFLQKPIDVEVVIKLIQKVEYPSILLVIENEQERQVLANYLNHHNYRAHATGVSAEVIELAQQISFSIIITDTSITAGEGLEMYKALTRITPTTLFILLDKSENSFTGINTKSIQENTPALDKPLDIDRLLSVLEKYAKQ